MLDKKQVNSAS